MKNKLIGGKGDSQSLQMLAKKHGVSMDILKKEYAKGLVVEREHTKDMAKIKEIVIDHLTEMPNYYTKLATIEKAGTAGQKKMHKVMKEFKQGTLKTSAGKKVTDRNQAIAIGISESQDVKKSGDEKELESGSKTLTEKQKESIRNYIKKTPKIEDENFHEFANKIGVNKHRAEEYVYSLVKIAQKIEKAKYADNDQNRKDGKAGLRYGNEIQGGKLHILEDHDEADMHYKDQVIKWLQEGKKFEWVQKKLEIYGVQEPDVYLKKIIKQNYENIID